jgi:type VI secretion system secreted protein Hcp
MAVDMFLKVDGIDGESQDKSHKSDIDILSFSWGASNSSSIGTGSGGGAGKVAMQSFNITFYQNQASPKLMLACASGEHIKKATFVCRKQGKEQQEFLKIILSDILISSYQMGASSGGDSIPIDQASIDFTKFEHHYKPQKADGSLGAAIISGWDVKGNVKV